MGQCLVIRDDFADPSGFFAVDNTWWAFGTQKGNTHVQIAESGNFDGQWNVRHIDALPILPDWVDQGNPLIWAPDVSQRKDGNWLMYFSAQLKGTNKHCIGAAVSTQGITGPYFGSKHPLVCPDPNGDGTGSQYQPAFYSPGQGGAIDPASFVDVTGQRYLIYKVDGNSLGSGGDCLNGNAPQRSTPIMIVPMDESGWRSTGLPIQILDRTSEDGPLVEAPSMGRAADGTYFLFYSNNCWSSSKYSVLVATSNSPTGPFTRRGAMLQTGVKDLVSPGGLAITTDGTHVVFHSNVAQYPGQRVMHAMPITLSANNIKMGY